MGQFFEDFDGSPLGSGVPSVLTVASDDRPDWVDIIMRVGTPTGFTSDVQGIGYINFWRTDWRHRFLRSLDANPHGGA